MAGNALAGRPEFLVIGGSGQVGGAVRRLLGARALATGRSPADALDLALDLEDLAVHPGLADRLLEKTRPLCTLIAAAFADVDGCEVDPGRAERVNTTAPAVLARASRQVGAKTVFLSSEYVFDGNDGPYDEGAGSSPLSAYGRSKAEGEMAVLDADPRALVVRTTVVYGPEERGKNFAYRVGRHLADGTALTVPNDQVSTPTYNQDLAASLMRAGLSSLCGVLHLAGPSLLARDQFALELAQACHLDGSVVKGVPTSTLHQRAPRPLQAGLISRRTGDWEAPAASPPSEAVARWLSDPYGLPWPPGAHSLALL